jgi:hypothetical protein
MPAPVRVAPPSWGPASENLHNSSRGTHPELDAAVAEVSATDFA